MAGCRQRRATVLGFLLLAVLPAVGCRTVAPVPATELQIIANDLQLGELLRGKFYINTPHWLAQSSGALVEGWGSPESLDGVNVFIPVPQSSTDQRAFDAVIQRCGYFADPSPESEGEAWLRQCYEQGGEHERSFPRASVRAKRSSGPDRFMIFMEL